MKKITAAVLAVLLTGCTSADSVVTQTVADTTTSVTTETTQVTVLSDTVTSAQTETDTETTTASETTESETQTQSDTETDTNTNTETDTETSQTAVSAEVDERYREAYKNKLTKMYEDNHASEGYEMAFSVFDVGGDATPELLISAGSFHAVAVEIYSLDKNGNAVFSGVAGSSGEMYYSPETGCINSIYGGMGGFYNELYRLENGKLSTIISMSGYAPYDAATESYPTLEATVNDAKCTEEEYYAAYDENFSGKYITLGRSYPLCPEFISAVFDGGDREEVYDSISKALAESSENAIYQRYKGDIDGDGNDELIVSCYYDYGDGGDPHSAYSYDVYTYRDGLVWMGSMPINIETPHTYFGMINDDISYESKNDPIYELYFLPDKAQLCFMAYSGATEIYTADISDMLIPADTFGQYTLTDGTSEYMHNGIRIEEDVYTELTGGFFDSGEMIISEPVI